MRVIIDTNIVVSAILRDRDPETVIMFIAGRNDMEWIVSAEILAEYRDVLSRPRFALPEDIKHRWFQMFEKLTVPVSVSLPFDFPRDRKDAPFLACAVAARADFLISGDKDFSDARELLSTTVLSISQFKKQVVDVLTATS